MALVQPSIFFSNIKGSVGGVTFSNNRSGLTAKKRLVGKRLPNTKQAAALNSSIIITNQWNALTSEEKEVFNDYALVNTYTSRYGTVKPLTGFQWYKQLAQAALYFDSIVLTSPPAFAIPAAIPSFSVDISPTDIILTWSDPIDTSELWIYCYTTLPLRGNARTQRGAYRLTDIRALDYSESFSITSAWEQTHGLPLAAFTGTGKFNLNVQMFAISKSSFVSGVAQSTFGAYSAITSGIGYMAVGSTFIIG